MNQRERLAQADWHIDMAKRQIARQKEIIKELVQAGHETVEAMSLLQAMETSLLAFERHRRLIVDRLDRPKDAGGVMTGKNRIMMYGPKNEGTHVVDFRTADGDTLNSAVRDGRDPAFPRADAVWAVRQIRVWNFRRTICGAPTSRLPKAAASRISR